ncbi:hypothetical protein G9A89_001149 [Geosiphon pyriformis]|nr:hypothetical protein G9A89_001149 [Geosiphon pyriformis]
MPHNSNIHDESVTTNLQSLIRNHLIENSNQIQSMLLAQQRRQEYLYSIGKYFCFDAVDQSDCTLIVMQENPETEIKTVYKEYPCHQVFLNLRSQYFRNIFSALNYVVGLETNSRVRIRVVLKEPEVSNFEELLYWMYTNDTKNWVQYGFTPQNHHLIAQNVHILGLGRKAMEICIRYKYMLQIPPRISDASNLNIEQSQYGQGNSDHDCYS